MPIYLFLFFIFIQILSCIQFTSVTHSSTPYLWAWPSEHWTTGTESLYLQAESLEPVKRADNLYSTLPVIFHILFLSSLLQLIQTAFVCGTYLQLLVSLRLQ